MPLIIFKAQYNLYVSWSGWTTSRAKWWRAACSRVGWEAPGALQPRRALLERPLPAETSEASLNKLTTIISLLDHGSVDYGASTIAHFVAQKLGLSAFVPLLCHALRSYSMWTNLATLNFVVHKLEGLILPVSKHSKHRHRSVMIIMRLLNVIFCVRLSDGARLPLNCFVCHIMCSSHPNASYEGYPLPVPWKHQ